MLLALLCSAVAVPAAAAPYTPGQDSEVLERLPRKRGDPLAEELRTMRAELAANPSDADAAARLARRYFELSLAEGDPRYVGYAEGALRPWPGDAPAEILFVRGLLKQYRHDFAGALGEMAQALRRDPGHIGARSWRAAIFMVGAEYRAAREECRALEPLASELITAGCHASVDGATGKARAGHEALKAALESRRDAPRELRLWALTRLAELAWRLGDLQSAEQHFRAALALDVKDNYLLAAYADFLLEQRRPKEVTALLANWAGSDTLLLRLALAAKAQGLPEAGKHAQALGERFAAAALRGERLHLGEEARFLLDLKEDPDAALSAALENWKTQREPRDAAIVMEAALAARNPKAAGPALRWLEESGFEGTRLRGLAARLR
jgi:Tfp pilus assembly protein PilF